MWHLYFVRLSVLRWCDLWFLISGYINKNAVIIRHHSSVTAVWLVVGNSVLVMHAAVTFPGSTGPVRSGPGWHIAAVTGRMPRNVLLPRHMKPSDSNRRSAVSLSPLQSLLWSLAHKRALYIFKIKSTKSTWWGLIKIWFSLKITTLKQSKLDVKYEKQHLVIVLYIFLEY